MSDRDPDRERRARQTDDDSDWDWYYYEYRYEPYYAAGNPDYGRNSGRNMGEDYARSYGRGQDYGRKFGRGFNQEYGQDYERSYDRGMIQDYGRNTGRSYGPDYGNDYSLYGVSNHWTRGRYSGMGPRGYRRSDERIKEDVNDRLTWHGMIDATDVQVEVQDGVVILLGTVNSRHEKRMAEDIAEGISGVSDVQNNLRINNQSNWNRGESNMEMNQQTQAETTETSKERR